MRVTVEIHTPRWLVSVSRTQRTIATAVLALALALVPTVALANHLFTDVPDTHPQHATISRVVAAGIMLPCTPTTFCPTGFVLRGQQAGQWDRALGLNGTPTAGTFVSRAVSADNLQGYAASSLSRGARNSMGSSITNAGSQTATIAITAPATGFVMVTGSLEATGTGCPCQVNFFLQDNVAMITMPVADGLVVNNGQWSSSALTWLYPVTAGARSFGIGAYIDTPASGATVSAYSFMTALFVPFGATGSPTSISSAGTVDGAEGTLATPSLP